MNVSLSGSTLTVNVDGHSDSVNLSSLTPLTGSITIHSNLPFANSNTTTLNTYGYSRYGNVSASYTTYENTVAVTAPHFTRSGYDWTMYDSPQAVPVYPVNVSIDNLVSSFSLNGSGKIILTCRLGYSSSAQTFYLLNSSPIITINVSDGDIRSVNFPFAYATRNAPPQVSVDSVTIQ